MDNYVRFTLMGGFIKMKRDVVPHIFNCQPDRKRSVIYSPRLISEERRRKAEVTDLMSNLNRSLLSNTASKENVLSIQTVSTRVYKL